LRSDFDSIIEQYGGMLSRVASTYEANPALQQELIQEISLAVWQGLRRFQGKSSVKTYILRIAHNRAVSHVNSQVKAPDFSEYDSVSNEPSAANTSITNPETQIANQQTVSTLLDAIRKLSLSARQIVTLSLEGLSYNEIAEICGTTTSNVGVVLNRSKQQIMSKIQ
jgi:RNA polymerase sigma-70 factor (ECF subfamily)